MGRSATGSDEHLGWLGGHRSGAVQPSLFELGEEPRPCGSSFERTELGRGAWVELCRSYLAAPTELFERLEGGVPWRADERVMYDRVVAVPRLVCFFEAADALPDPVLREAKDDLSRHYERELPGGFASVGLCYYRDGRDSVAWHGDRIGRGSREDTIVAICSLGNPRRFLLRPSGGGASRPFELWPGDLLVMGGSCQRTFEHCVPKTSRPIGPRISVQFRQAGVR